MSSFKTGFKTLGYISGKYLRSRGKELKKIAWTPKAKPLYTTGPEVCLVTLLHL
jgi:hypothetical protein